MLHTVTYIGILVKCIGNVFAVSSSLLTSVVGPLLLFSGCVVIVWRWAVILVVHWFIGKLVNLCGTFARFTWVAAPQLLWQCDNCLKMGVAISHFVQLGWFIARCPSTMLMCAKKCTNWERKIGHCGINLKVALLFQRQRLERLSSFCSLWVQSSMCGA